MIRRLEKELRSPERDRTMEEVDKFIVKEQRRAVFAGLLTGTFVVLFSITISAIGYAALHALGVM